jgi:hypothetical protein
MGIALSTIGIKVSYAVETTAGTRPTADYTHIPDLKSIPSFNPSPNTADATTFDNTEYTSYVQLLKDLGGALEICALSKVKLIPFSEYAVTEDSPSRSNVSCIILRTIPTSRAYSSGISIIVRSKGKDSDRYKFNEQRYKSSTCSSVK